MRGEQRLHNLEVTFLGSCLQRRRTTIPRRSIDFGMRAGISIPGNRVPGLADNASVAVHDQAMDRALSLAKAFAGALRKTVRESDVAGRWGGEEFALVLPGTDAEGGARLAERARLTIEGRQVKMPNGDLCSVTASFGVAAYPESRELGEILAAADSALYTAKAAGKNRVMIATEPITT